MNDGEKIGSYGGGSSSSSILCINHRMMAAVSVVLLVFSIFICVYRVHITSDTHKCVFVIHIEFTLTQTHSPLAQCAK